MSEISNARQRLIDAVKEYAAEHYDEGGWDVLVETYSDEDIFNATRQCRTANGAIKVLAEDLGVVEAVRQDVIAAGDDAPDCRMCHASNAGSRTYPNLCQPCTKILETEAARELAFERKYS